MPLHVWKLASGAAHVIAESADEACAIWDRYKQRTSGTSNEQGFSRMPDNETLRVCYRLMPYTIEVEKTCQEWVEARGKCVLAAETFCLVSGRFPTGPYLM